MFTNEVVAWKKEICWTKLDLNHITNSIKSSEHQATRSSWEKSWFENNEKDSK
jgi:hypothetical protein